MKKKKGKSIYIKYEQYESIYAAIDFISSQTDAVEDEELRAYYDNQLYNLKCVCNNFIYKK